MRRARAWENLTFNLQARRLRYAMQHDINRMLVPRSLLRVVCPRLPVAAHGRRRRALPALRALALCRAQRPRATAERR